MKTVVSHSSFNSADGSAELLANMFTDSEIAKNMKIASTKMAYLINYGLATFFRERLQDVLAKADLFVICFDESLNKVAQRGQMDLAVRYYMKNEDKEEVVTQYFNSAFLQKASASDLLTKFKEGLSGLPMSKILQVSMDGPNVNWAFLRQLKDDLLSLDSEAAALLELGCCGLHVIHGAFQTGHTKATWNVNQILTFAYYVFKDSPARRADLTNLTGSTCFPPKFCRTRWIENKSASTRFLEISKNPKKFVENNPKMKNPSQSWKNLETAFTSDSFLIAKVSFFSAMANEVEPFLTRFQTSKPLSPFLYEACDSILRDLLKRIVKLDIDAMTTSQLMDIDLETRKNCSWQKKLNWALQLNGS